MFGYWVENPRPFGVVEFDEDGRAISIEEKPRHPKSNYIIPGIYFYDNQAMEIVANLTPSQRGELEITDVNLEYLRRDQLQVLPLERDVVWLDAGTADSLMDAGQTIRNIQAETGRYVGCLEELAFNQGWLTEDQVHEAELTSITEQRAEGIRFVRWHDHHDIGNARLHENCKRVVNHGLVVNRQQRLAHRFCHRVKARAFAGG